MTTTIISMLTYKLMAIILSVFFIFNPYVSPSTADTINLNNDTQSKMTFIALADPQISNYMPKRTSYFDAACEDLENISGTADALMMAGDIAENGLLCEYQYIYDGLKNAKVNNYIMAVGNHDLRMKLSYKKTVENFTHLTNLLNENVSSDLNVDSLNYSYTIKGYKFIVLGSDKTEFEESSFSGEQLSWLKSELEGANATGLPAFVICHQPLKLTHGLPDTWNSPFDAAGSVGKQSEELYNILNSFKNVFFITGHLHTGIGRYTYEKLGNINSVNLPSLTIDNKDGDNNENGIGFVVSVYSDHVLFKARNFAKGTYAPENDIDIPLV